MITYKRCNDVDEDLIYEAFTIGFSDYIVKFNMAKEAFFNHFFGAEGNSKEHSFIALDNNKPIGVIFGGINIYEGIKTMRCGTLAVIPEYRGKEVSQELFKLHKNEGLNNNCTQLFLEVITENYRAVRFYESLGYEKYKENLQ
ncbi:GNAT family N-acetyltransferase [Clostridium sp.]|uniref:GNAT family N-acetyltransferase n=1 Tax=Clostridium sp. TaxID=1506 RepID=UPI003463CC73